MSEMTPRRHAAKRPLGAALPWAAAWSETDCAEDDGSGEEHSSPGKATAGAADIE